MEVERALRVWTESGGASSSEMFNTIAVCPVAVGLGVRVPPEIRGSRDWRYRVTEGHPGATPVG